MRQRSIADMARRWAVVREVAKRLAESVPVAVEDVSHLEGGAVHWAQLAGCGRGSRSSGLVVVETLELARCRVRAVVERLRWPSRSWMVRTSVPASSR